MKLKKQVTAFFMACIMAGSMILSGCNLQGKETFVTETSKGLKGKKIGMTLFVNDGLFAAMYDYVSTLAEAAGVELISDVGAFSPEDQVASVENLIAAGCDGIIYSNFGEESLTKIAQICDEAEVYWVQYCRDIADKDVENILNESKYYVGRTIEENYQVGVNIADKFHEKGIKKTAIVGPTPGDNTTDSVAEGYKAKANEYDMEIYAEVRNCEDGADCEKAVETILACYPDTEAIVVLSGSTGKLEGVLAGLDSMGKLGKVSVGALDGTVKLSEDISAGYVDICHMGNYADPGFALAILLNAVAGTPLSDEKIVISYKHIVISSKEDADNYENYVENTKDRIYAYTGEEFKQWLKVYNPDASVELIQEAAANYSIEDVMKRHKKNASPV